MMSTIIVLQVANALGYIKLPKFTLVTLSGIWPLPLFYVGESDFFFYLGMQPKI